MAEAVAILDTNILIDLLREYVPAQNWMQRNSSVSFAIPSLVRMELVWGARRREDQTKIIKLIKHLPIIFPDESDAQWAMEQFEIYHLSHQIEIIDCFIAAMSVRLKLHVYSRHAKDLSVFPGVSVVIPY